MEFDERLVTSVRQRMNLAVVAITALVTLAVLHAGVNETEPDWPQGLRHVGSGLCAFYAMFHLFARWRLQGLSRRDDVRSRLFVEVCRDPCRITNLDLAAYWALFMLVVPRLLPAG